METTYFGLFLLILFKITTFLLLLSSNIGKVAELWTLLYRQHIYHFTKLASSVCRIISKLHAETTDKK